MKKFLGTFGILIMLGLALAAGYFLSRATMVPDTTGSDLLKKDNDRLVAGHIKDSVIYARVMDSLTSLAYDIEVKIAEKDRVIIALRNLYAQRRENISQLTAQQDIDLFNCRTADTGVLIVSGRDTTARISMMAVKRCNALFLQLDEEQGVNSINIEKISLLNDMIEDQKTMINVKNMRIDRLNTDWKESQRVISEFSNLNDDLRKKMRRRNWMLGGAVAAAAAGIVVAIVK